MQTFQQNITWSFGQEQFFAKNASFGENQTMYFGILVIIILRLARKVLGNRTLEDLVCPCLSFVVQKDHEDIVKIQSLLIRDTSFTRNIFKSNTKTKQLNTKTNKKASHSRKKELPGIRSEIEVIQRF